MSIIPWNNNLLMNFINDSLDPWTNNYKIQLLNDENNILYEICITNKIYYIVYYPILNKNIFIFCYLEYVNDKPCIIINFYSVTNNEIIEIQQHQIKIKYTLGSLIGKLCIYDENTYYVIFGDIINYNYFSCIKFNIEGYEPEIKINLNPEVEFEKLYLLHPEYIIFSKTMHNNKTLQITLFNNDEMNCFSLVNLELDVNEIVDTDSMIFDFFLLYCLVRIKVYDRIDILHIKPFFLDVIIHINGIDSTIVDISKPIYFDKSKDYNGYFGTKPFILVSNNKIKIFQN